jgi:hypothetical protein
MDENSQLLHIKKIQWVKDLKKKDVIMFLCLLLYCYYFSLGYYNYYYDNYFFIDTSPYVYLEMETITAQLSL